MGRTATGVRGMRIDPAHEVISLMVVEHNDEIHQVLIGTANGFGKRTPMQDFPQQKRGGQGVIAVQTTDRNGDVIGAVMVAEGDQAMLITDRGTLVRTAVHEISSMGRNTQGVTLIRLGEDERMMEIEAVQTLGDVVDDTSADADDSADDAEPTIH